MAKEFGWAYVAGRQGSGPKGSIQLAGEGVELEHDTNLIWSDDLNSLLVSGNIVAHNFEIQNQTKTVFNFEVSGSSIFGDTEDDLHQFTGSLDVTGNVSALNFYGWGGDLDGVAINYYTNHGDNRLVTSVSGDTVNAEENLTFDGAVMNVVGDINAIEIDAAQLSGTIGLFDSVDVEDLDATLFTDGTLSITEGSLTSANHIQSTTIEGLLTSPSQTNITEVGTLTSLNVANDATINGTLYVKSGESKVGVNVSDPQATSEILSTSTQLRLTSQRGVFGVQDLEYTDLHTNTDGDFTISPSNGNTNVTGDLNVSGDLVVTGSLIARMTDFSVSADTLTLGDEPTDNIIVNANTMTTPNNLSINDDLYIASGKVSVGAPVGTSKFQVSANANQFSITDEVKTMSISLENGSTTLSTTSNTLDIANSTRVLSDLVVGSSGDITLSDGGEASASTSMTAPLGLFNDLESDSITVGNTSILSETIETPTLNATSISGTLTTPAQTNITDVGTLTSLNVGGLTRTDTLAIGTDSPSKKVEIKDSTDAQLRLTSTEYVFGLSQHQYVDFKATQAGDLEISPTSGVVKMSNLNLSNIQQGSSSAFLSLDESGNVILSPTSQSGIEVRNRKIVTQTYQIQTNDYFIGIQAQQDLDITLPNASTLFNGQIFVLKDEIGTANANVLTIKTIEGQLIDGESEIRLLSPYTGVSIYTDGSGNYFLF